MSSLADAALRVLGAALALYLFGVPVLVAVSVLSHPSWLLAALVAAGIAAAYANKRLG